MRPWRSVLSPWRLVDIGLVLLLAITLWRVAGVRGLTEGFTDAVPTITPAVKRGDIMRLPGVTWSKPRTVVLVVSSACPACNENISFYREIATLTRTAPEIETVAVSQEPVELVTEWMRTNAIDVQRAYHLDDALTQGLTLTPMVILVEGDGRVTDIMFRKLRPADQAGVLHRIRDRQAAALDNSLVLREVSLAHLKRPVPLPPQLIDFRSRERFQRGHRAGARNIPLEELEARAAVELNAGVPIVVDCLQPGAAKCRSAAWALINSGFEDVSILIR